MSDCCERHIQDVAAAVTEAAGDEPVGFDPASLLTIVLPILTEMLSGCMSQRGRRSVEQRLENPDVWTRIAMNRAIRRGSRESGIRVTERERDIVRDGLQSFSASGGMADVLDEVSQNSEWVML